MEHSNINRTGQSANVRGAAPVRPAVPANMAPAGGSVSMQSSGGKTKKGQVTKLILAVLTLVLVAGAFFAYQLLFAGARIDGGKYQAVFLANGQVYFGKLKDTSGEYMYLNDVYYIQAKTAGASAGNPQDTETQTGVELVKLGNEVHGPVDEMTIRKEQVLFFENLKQDGQVAKTIAEDKKPK